MTRKEIKAERKKLEAEMDEAKLKVEEIRLRMRFLEKRCVHPNMRKYSACGDIGTICDDCGYQT